MSCKASYGGDMHTSSLRLALSVLTLASPVIAAPPVQSPTSFPAAFFTDVQPTTALDMLSRVPGFTLNEGDDVRGLAGSAGNVVIDGRRGGAKDEKLEDILGRIPARSVERIDLIRDSAQVDLGGHAVVANVIRRREAALRGRAEATATAYRDGTVAPGFALDGSRRSGDQLVELSLSLERSLDDDEGSGPRNRLRPDGSLARRADYAERKATTEGKFSGKYESPVAGGNLSAVLSATRARERADILQTRIAPVPGLETDLELEGQTSGELRLNYIRPTGQRSSLEVTALQRLNRINAAQSSRDGTDVEETTNRAESRETVVRAVLRSKRTPSFSLEAGTEAAYNVLDSQSTLTSGGLAIPLPNDSVVVAEQRAEAFLAATLTPNPRLVIEAGLRAEGSILTQRGDTRVRRSAAYPKPNLALTWSPTPDDSVRLSAERKVGQLSFTDFASSTSLGSGTVTAGNANLRPESVWLLEARLEHRFGKGGIILLLRHHELSDVVDRIPIVAGGATFDAVGNIGRGAKDEATVELTLPLTGFGITGGLLRADATYIRSRVVDPTTAALRPISRLIPLSAAAHYSQDLPRAHARWGVDVRLPESQRQFRFDEVRYDRKGLLVGTYAEYNPVPAWRIRVAGENLTSRTRQRTRSLYDGPRNTQPLDETEERRLRFGRYFSISARRTFG